MRKTIILAISTIFLAGASVATDLARTFHAPTTISALPVVVPLAIGSQTASDLPGA